MAASPLAVARALHTQPWRTLLVHLRLPFQLLLAPVFLWGWLASGGGWSGGVLLAFVAFHMCLYGGATAFNSYFDRDEGPVGGLEHPPAIVPALLPFSLGMQALGWVLASLVAPALGLIYGGFVVLSVAYSHPSIRWKARPALSLLVVGFGQGVLGYLGGWAAARGSLVGVDRPDGLLGAAAAALLILGSYPLSQLFQVEEDARRGDRTIAVAWGVPAAFRLALACQLLGGAAFVLALWDRFGTGDAELVGLGIAAQAGAVLAWSRRFNARDVPAAYRTAMRLNTAGSAALSLYLLARLLLALGAA